MKKRSSYLVLLAIIMIIGFLGACADGDKNNNNNENESSSSPNNTEDNADNNTIDENGFSKTVNLDIPVYDRAFEGWNVADNFYTQKIQEEFGDKNNIDLNFVPIARSNEVTDFQQLLAAGKAPAIIFHYDMPQMLTYYSSEIFQPIDFDEIAKYAPTYSEKLKETNEQYGVVNEENIFFFAERPDIGNHVGIIRKDWVEQVGMKVEDLTSLEKYNEMLEKWKEEGLGVAGAGLQANVFNYSYAFRDWPLDEEHHALYSDLSVADFTTEATESWLRNLNYLYNNGLIDQEFYLRTDGNMLKSEFVAGNTGTYGEYISSNTDLFEATLANNPGAEFAVTPPYSGIPEGNIPQGRADWPFGMIMGINEAASEEERIAVWLYLEWMSQPDNLFLLQNGIEDENYTLDSENLPVANTDYTGEAILSANNNKDYWCLVTEAPDFGSEELTRQAMSRFWAPQDYEYIVEDMFQYQDETKEYAYPDPLFSVVVESVNDHKADLNALFQELYVQIVLGPEDKFDEAYEAAKQRFLDAGYQEILDEKQEAIDNDQVR